MKSFCLVLASVLVFLTVSPSASGAVISEKLLNQAGLSTVWQSAIALDAGEKVQRIDVLGDYLYILTDTNYLFCLNRNTGKLSFAITIALPRMPVSAPSFYKNTAYIVAANKLITFDIQQGMEIFRVLLPMPVSGAAAANGSYIYLPGMDKRLHVMNPNGEHEIFKATADNVSGVTSVLATDAFVIFATDGGNVICMHTSEPKRFWQFNAVGGITAPLTSTADWIYASSRDTNLYKLKNTTGEQMWKFHAGSTLTTPARAAQTAVYQYAEDKGLYAIDANSGKQLWLLPDGIDLLSQNGSTAYVMDKNNICVVMDNKQAKKIYTISFAPVTTYAANADDAKMYVMDGKNISCIAPTVK